ncbi:MAG: carbon monoxide dehydrogenase [Alphaproteobacteria bacterium]|nr:carbon monoxide dehydrogenase [Alphaproteobacteria bacterium]
MKPAKFDYERATDVAHAIGLLKGSGGFTKILAGGQSLGPMMNLRLAQPDLLVDIGRIEALKRIEKTHDSLFIGALVRHAMIEDGKAPDTTRGYLRSIAGNIAYRAVRNRGTVGGSVVHADPSGDWPTAMLAAGASARITSANGARSVGLDAFFTGAYSTVVGEDEVLEGLSVPAFSDHARWGYYKICRKPGEFADSIGAVVIDPARSYARVVLGATDGAPILLPALASRVAAGQAVSIADAGAAIDAVHSGFDPFDRQIHATALSRAITKALAA